MARDLLSALFVTVAYPLSPGTAVNIVRISRITSLKGRQIGDFVAAAHAWKQT